VRSAWQERALDGRLILNTTQEQTLWSEIVANHPGSSDLVEGSRHRMARLAMDAHALICAYAPRFLNASARATWQQDPAAFSAWLAAFDRTCRAGNLISLARLPLELLPLLENSVFGASRDSRPPLLLAGFDRLQPVQHELFDAWGEWREIGVNEPAETIRFYNASDPHSELAACALWCSCQLAANPQARLLVVTQDATLRRGEIERAFLRHADSLFEFSLGIPLAQVPLAKSAQMLLRWLSTSLSEHELDWLFAAGDIGSAQESAALQAVMRAIRRRGREQPEWPLTTFLAQTSATASLPAPWITRITEARQHLADHARQAHSPLEWAELAPQLLQTAGWPGVRPLSSAEFQAARRFQKAIETAGSLGFDGRRVPWQEFLAALGRILDETLFAPETRDAPIQISGPAESAGLAADAVWFLGAHEEAWPSAAPTHPLLPPEVQRQFAMPHAAPQLDWELARAITARLVASAPEVYFSFARQIEGVETRPSRLVAQFAGPAQPLPTNLDAPPIPAPLTETIEDPSLSPFPPGKVEGGAAVLTAQSQCPFKAFATVRLAAHAWEPAQPALTPAQRGKLLHSVLKGIWAGPPEGLRTLDDLQNLKERSSFVAGHVRRALQDEIRPNLRARLPRRYLELEEQRLVRLVSEWLDYESNRIAFVVVETEQSRTVHLAGLTLDLRLDRLDRLNDGALLVIDYKSGNVTPKSWDLPRPDDLQLPLYAGFALDSGAELGGLAFAKVRPGNSCFAGRVGDAQATLLSGLSGRDGLVQNPFTAEQLLDWRDIIEKLARDFLSGRAEVDPRDPPKTCKCCGLQILCRILENQPELESDDGSDVAGDADFAEAADE
ncbi:MAG: PD-(D/E)XK nuclease family protein, partial [Terracidiphilus sp.]